MLAGFAPNDQPDAGGGGIAERHRWAGRSFRYGQFGICPATPHSITLETDSNPRSRSKCALVWLQRSSPDSPVEERRFELSVPP
jgi:hypothetical protein